jgi:hypothetical protein
MFATRTTRSSVTEELDVARDLLAGVRDHLQSKIAENQNEVGKKLTVIASSCSSRRSSSGSTARTSPGDSSAATGRRHVRWAHRRSTLVQVALFRWRTWI